MTDWFGPIRTRHNPPPEALEMEVPFWGPMKKGDVLAITIPATKDMILSKGMEIHLKVVCK